MFRRKLIQWPNNALLEAFPSNPGSGDEVISATSYFSADGGPIPWYAGATNYSAFKDGTKTYIFYQSHLTTLNQRLNKVIAYDHATDTWGRSYGTGEEGVTADAHGVPAACVNSDGRYVTVYGDHDGSLHISTSTNVGDETVWTTISDGIVGNYTYPHLVLQGTTVYCFLRKNFAPGEGGFAAGAKVLVYRPITFAGATATVGAEVTVGDLGNNSRWYQGPAFVSDGLIWQCCDRADYNDTFRRDVYVYGIDIANQRLQTWDGATTTVFPVAGATMNSTYRLVTTPGGSNNQIPSMVKDTDGRWHIVYSTAVADTDDVPIYHMYASTYQAAWSSPAAIGTSVVSRDQDAPRIIDQGSGIVGVYWPNDPKTVETFASGGNVYRRLLPSGSTTWGSEELVAAFDTTRWSFNQIAPVFNADPDLRVLWSEVAGTEDDTQVIPPKRLYAYGDSGVISRAATSAPDPVAWTGQGYWIDMTDAATMFSDAAGTIPAVIDGPVGFITDKSGNANDFVAQGSEFPIWRTDGDSYWLDFGDVNSPTSHMLSPSFAKVSSNAFWVLTGARVWMATEATIDILSVDRGSTNGTRIARILRGSDGTPSPQAFNAGGTGFTMTDGVVVRYGSDWQSAIYCTGTSGTAYKNGVQSATATITGGTYDTTWRTRLGAGVSSAEAVQQYTRGRIYSVIWRAGVVDLATREADMAWHASTMPKS